MILKRYMEKETTYGQAYAFFNCEASKEKIEAELPFIRECVRTPSELELSLTEGFKNLTGDDQLMALVREAKEDGMRYVLKAKYKDATNKRTADEIADILNQASQTPLCEQEELRGKIVYQNERGEYIFRK